MTETALIMALLAAMSFVDGSADQAERSLRAHQWFKLQDESRRDKMILVMKQLADQMLEQECIETDGKRVPEMFDGEGT